MQGLCEDENDSRLEELHLARCSFRPVSCPYQTEHLTPNLQHIRDGPFRCPLTRSLAVAAGWCFIFSLARKLNKKVNASDGRGKKKLDFESSKPAPSNVKAQSPEPWLALGSRNCHTKPCSNYVWPFGTLAHPTNTQQLTFSTDLPSPMTKP